MLDFSTPLLMLAPLAGYTDPPFRAVVKRFGADVTVSEMISANALKYRNAKTTKMLEKSDNETPYSVQLASNDPLILAEAVAFLNECEGIDIIDLNCGCPVPKIVKNGAGSALLLDLCLLGKLVSTIKRHSNKPYTSAKIRIGFTQKQPEEIARVCEDAGADFLVVHGRTRSDGFRADRIDYESIARIKAAVKIPVIANGEIDSAEKAALVLQETGTDGVMIGRGAVGNPWIFHQIRHHESEVPLLLKKEIALEHFDRMISFYGKEGVGIFRKHLHTYSKGLRDSSRFRDEVNRIEDAALVRYKIETFFSESAPLC